jgi:K+-transporting ATPase ATPase B chain
VYAAPGVSSRELAEGALFASLADDTAEGKSIVEYLRGHSIRSLSPRRTADRGAVQR